MKTDDAIERMLETRFSTPPEPQRLMRVAQRILETWPDMAAPLPEERDRRRILEEFLDRIERWQWEGTTYADLNRAARLAFDPEFLNEHRFARVRRFVLDELAVTGNCAFIVTAFRIYWESWAAGAPHSQALGEILGRHMQKADRRACLKRWETLLAEAEALFTPQAAPAQVAGLLLEAEDVAAARQTLKLRALPLRGLQEEALSLWLRESGKAAHEPKTAYRILEWLETDSQAARLPRLAADAIEALVRPWLSRDCPDRLRQEILDRLLRLYKDPRVHPGDPWPRVSEKVKEHLRHWLIGRDIDFFMDVIERSMSKENERRMWRDRRRFWEGLYKKGDITDSWVAFSDEAIHILRSMEKGHIEYGRQIAGGARKRTSLLIMQIRNAIVVEGSHNYMVHVFCHGEQKAPRLHQHAYDCERIRYASKGHNQIRHLGNWEARVLECIYHCS